MKNSILQKTAIIRYFLFYVAFSMVTEMARDLFPELSSMVIDTPILLVATILAFYLIPKAKSTVMLASLTMLASQLCYYYGYQGVGFCLACVFALMLKDMAVASYAPSATKKSDHIEV